MSRQLPKGITNEATASSVLSTLNPFSKLFLSDKPEYVPDFMLNAFSKGLNDSRGAKTAHLITKLIAGLGVGSIGAFGLRALMHHIDSDNSKYNQAGASATKGLLKYYYKPNLAAITSLYSQESDTSLPLQKLAKLNDYSFGVGVATPALFLLTALGMFKSADSLYDSILSSQLDLQIAAARQLQDAVNNRRILKGRGIDLQSLQKNASIISLKGDVILGAGAALLAALSFTVGFNKLRVNDPLTLKYKAAKDALQTYVKTNEARKASTISPLDEQLVRMYDSNLKGGGKGFNVLGLDTKNLVGI